MKRIAIKIFIFSLGFGLTTFTYASGKISHISFKFENKGSVLEIEGEALGGYQTERNSEQNQVTLKFHQTEIGSDVNRQIDLADLESDIKQISVSTQPVPDGVPDALIVIHFKREPKFQVTDSDHKLVFKVDDHSTGRLQIAQPALDGKDTLASLKSVSITTEQHSADALADFVEAKSTNTFSGSPVSLHLKDADVREVLRLIGEASGFNVLVHPGVTGRISLSLDRVPWDQALDVVLNTMGLAADRSNNILRVVPRDVFMQDKQKEFELKNRSAEVAPKITRIFPISYAKITELQKILDNFLRSQGATNSGGMVIIDNNTNSIIVRDVTENVDRAKKMIELLDVQTPQVLIEAKVVEVTQAFTHNIGGNNGVQWGNFVFGVNGNNPSNLLGSLSGSTGSSGSSGSSSSGIGLQGFSSAISQGLSMGQRGTMVLNAALSMAESVDDANIVSSPRLVVVSGETANINQTETTNVPQQTVTSTGQIVSTFVPLSAKTSLNVTPRVTNDGSVFVKLDVSRDLLVAGASGSLPHVDPRTMTTQVVVESGGTIVIGGVLNLDEDKSSAGIPLLRDIPLIGWLFGSENITKNKTELMFFVTPRVLNPKKTGIQAAEG